MSDTTEPIPQAAARLTLKQRYPDAKMCRLLPRDCILELNGVEVPNWHAVSITAGDSKLCVSATIELYVDEIEVEGEGILTTFLKVPEPPDAKAYR